MKEITECPCCGNVKYEIPQTSEDDAIMACPWCLDVLDEGCEEVKRIREDRE